MKVYCTSKIPKKLRSHVINISKFTVDTIFTKRQSSKLDSISIRLDKSLANNKNESVALAYMDYLVEDEKDFHKPSKFIIWISPMFTKKTISKMMKTLLMETIVHEIVHVRQTLTGQMKQVVKNGKMVIKFQKKYYSIDASQNYWLFPWEIEARGYERGVLNLYCIKYECFKEFPDTYI